MKIVAIVEARMGSRRLTGKVLMPARGQPLLGILIDRLKTVSHLNSIVVATTTNGADEAIVDVAHDYGVDAYRGSEEDVLGRVSGALADSEATVCVEITADCPLIDPGLVASMIDRYRATAGQHLYVGNTTGPVPGAPSGQDIQVFAADALFAADAETSDPSDREHVSKYLYRTENAQRFRPLFMQQFPEALARRVWVTLDYQEDYELLRSAHENFDDPYFGIEQLIAFYDAHPELSWPCLNRRGLDRRGLPASPLLGLRR
jgi:spore coat polysaccharide biosynthesis protein SpsF